MKLLSLIVQLPSLVLIALVRVYQLTLSPIIGQQCRFQPTCSHYMIEAIRKYGTSASSAAFSRRAVTT